MNSQCDKIDKWKLEFYLIKRAFKSVWKTNIISKWCQNKLFLEQRISYFIIHSKVNVRLNKYFNETFYTF